jgi:hypothetical protein
MHEAPVRRARQPPRGAPHVRRRLRVPAGLRPVGLGFDIARLGATP